MTTLREELDGIDEDMKRDGADSKAAVQLDTVARIVEGWLEWSSQSRSDEGLQTDDNTYIMSLPVPHWPSHGQLRNWVSLFRRAEAEARAIADLKAKLESLRAENERLVWQRNLRDEFLVKAEMWDAFVSSLQETDSA